MDAESAEEKKQKRINAADAVFQRKDGAIRMHYNARGTCLQTSLSALAKAVGAGDADIPALKRKLAAMGLPEPKRPTPSAGGRTRLS